MSKTQVIIASMSVLAVIAVGLVALSQDAKSQIVADLSYPNEKDYKDDGLVSGGVLTPGPYTRRIEFKTQDTPRTVVLYYQNILPQHGWRAVTMSDPDSNKILDFYAWARFKKDFGNGRYGIAILQGSPKNPTRMIIDIVKIN